MWDRHMVEAHGCPEIEEPAMDVDMTVNIGVDLDFDAAAPQGCMVVGCTNPTAVVGGGFCRAHGGWT